MIDLYTQIKECTNCPLYQNMPLGPVSHVDNGSSVLIIGEAPGETESLLEEPFVGSCGKFLEKQIFTPLGLQRNQFNWTNLVKCMCRDGNVNRKPAPKEVQACKPLLDKELNKFSPKAAICLGNESAYRTIKCLKRSDKMKDIIGKKYTFGGTDYFPCYHPSFLMQYGRQYTDEVILLFKNIQENYL